tara:strand:- start:210 stop:452 length:243 start_codon:yes stop_codon:yes gene_type:complete
MGICKFCELEVCETWYGNWCEKCRKLKHIINLFKLDKVMNVLSNVLIVDEEKQKEKIKEELKTQLHIREYDLKKRRDEDK